MDRRRELVRERYVKLQANVIREQRTVDDAAISGQEHLWSRTLRLQSAFENDDAISSRDIGDRASAPRAVRVWRTRRRAGAAGRTGRAPYGSALNDVWVHINARDWADLHTNYLDDTYYPVDFEWQGVKIRNSGIRVRGNATRSGHKPSFRIDFNRYVDGQDLAGLKAIVLNNMWHDPSMLHDRLSMLTFRRVGISAPRQAHVRLFVGAGHENAGVYAISEEVSQTFLAANFGANDGTCTRTTISPTRSTASKIRDPISAGTFRGLARRRTKPNRSEPTCRFEISSRR